jgi:glycosyltransferase involved in cell wall biosynthesis/uncharacterized membrane protein YbhN (UPF0104 family)
MRRWRENSGSLIIVALSIMLLVIALWLSGATNVLQDLQQFPVWTVVLIIGIFALNLAIVSFRLARILHHFGIRLPAGIASRASISGHLAGLLVLSIFGQVVGRHLILRRHGVSSVIIAALTAYERVVLVFVGGSLCLTGSILLINTTEIAAFFTGFRVGEIILIVSVVLAFNMWSGRAGPERALIAKVSGKSSIAGFLEVTAVTFFTQMLVLASFVVGVLALYPESNIVHTIAAAAIISFAASIPISVNGWGVRELTAVYILGPLGVPSSSALAVSILVGICSTLVILASAPIALRKHGATASHTHEKSPVETGSGQAPGLLNVERMTVWAIALVAAVLVFFQVHINLASGQINVNLADPVAILALAAVLAHSINIRQFPIWRVPGLNMAFVAISLLIAFAFTRGVLEIGVTQWALAARVIGWLVLMGYISIGYLIVSFIGQHGFRRFIETLVGTAVIIIVFQVCVRWLSITGFDVVFPITANFEGYSSNRNAFAFQLLICSALMFAYSSPLIRMSRIASHRALLIRNERARSATGASGIFELRLVIYSLLQGLVLLGVYYTGSVGGLITGIALLLSVFFFKLTDRRLVVMSVVISIALWGTPYLVLEISRLFDSEAVAHVTHMVGTAKSGDGSHVLRWATMTRGLELWWSAPLFGAGLGVFIANSISWADKPTVIHSTPIWMISEFGLFGLAIFLWAFYLLVRFLRTNGVNLPANRAIALMLLVFGLFCLIHEIFYQRIFWLVLGGVAAARLHHCLSRGTVPQSVCHIITGLDAGGAERMLTRLVVAPDGARVTHRVISLMGEGVFGRELRAQGVPLSTLDMKRGLLPSPLALWRLVQMLRHEKPDILMSWLYHADLLGFIAGRLANVRQIFWNIRCSDMTEVNRSVFYRALMWILAHLSPYPTGVAVNSESGRKHHVSCGYRPKAWSLIPNGVDLDRFHPEPGAGSKLRAELGIPEHSLVAGHVGRFHPMKDYGTLLAAAAEVIKANPNTHFVLVGKDVSISNEFFANRIDKGELAGCVHLLGARQDIPAILAGLDLLVLSSAYGEGSPNVIIEAMACAVPCVVTDVGDAARIVGDTGFVSAARDPASLAENISAYMAKPEAERHVAGQEALARTQENYGIEKAIMRYSELFLGVDRSE